MPLWNRSSSLAKSSGIIGRTGGNIGEVFKKQSIPAQTTTQTGWLDKTRNWIGDHAKGLGKVAGGIASAGASILDYTRFGGIPVASALTHVGKSVLAGLTANREDSRFGAFASGLNS